ncbi:MAG: hypothetical protein FWD68_09385 [Alphaproteobacteria bacterium]|nr:hypothetical protein [Alphaproteobacteria bacterium]
MADMRIEGTSSTHSFEPAQIKDAPSFAETLENVRRERAEAEYKQKNFARALPRQDGETEEQWFARCEQGAREAQQNPDPSFAQRARYNPQDYLPPQDREVYDSARHAHNERLAGDMSTAEMSVRTYGDTVTMVMGRFDRFRNTAEVNMLRHTDPKEMASTVVHEATHQRRFFRGKPEQTQYGEYLAMRNGSLFKRGRRPDFAERQKILQEVKEIYPHLPSGKNPFERWQ